MLTVCCMRREVCEHTRQEGCFPPIWGRRGCTPLSGVARVNVSRDCPLMCHSTLHHPMLNDYKSRNRSFILPVSSGKKIMLGCTCVTQGTPANCFQLETFLTSRSPSWKCGVKSKIGTPSIDAYFLEEQIACQSDLKRRGLIGFLKRSSQQE